MPAIISSTDLRLQIILNLEVARATNGHTRSEAIRLAQFWKTHLPASKREALEQELQLAGLAL